MILNSVWGYEFFPEYADGGRARGEAAAEAGTGRNTPRHFLTVHGVGYRFVP